MDNLSKDILKIIFGYTFDDYWVNDIVNYFRKEKTKIKEQIIEALLNIPDYLDNKLSTYTPFDENYNSFGFYNIKKIEEYSNEDILKYLGTEKEIFDFNDNTLCLLVASKYGNYEYLNIFLEKYEEYNQTSKYYNGEFIPFRSKEVKNFTDKISKVLDVAIGFVIEANSLRCLKLLLKYKKYYNKSAVVNAVKSNNLEIINYLKNYRYKEVVSWYSDKINEGYDKEIILNAIAYLDLNKFNDLYNLIPNKFLNDCFSIICRLQRYDFIESFIEKYPSYPTTGEPLEYFVLSKDKSNNIDLYYRYFCKLFERNPETKDFLSYFSILANETEIFRYLAEKGAKPRNNMNYNDKIYDRSLKIFDEIGINNIYEKFNVKSIITLFSNYLHKNDNNYIYYHNNYFFSNVLKNKNLSMIKEIIEKNNIRGDIYLFIRLLPLSDNSILEYTYEYFSDLINDNLALIFFNSIVENNEDMVKYILENKGKELESKFDELKQINGNIDYIQKYDIYEWIIINNGFNIYNILTMNNVGRKIIKLLPINSDKYYNFVLGLAFKNKEYSKKVYENIYLMKNIIEPIFGKENINKLITMYNINRNKKKNENLSLELKKIKCLDPRGDVF
jgi:hypothetical protein